MTRLYDWNPMPHTVDIKCPECNSHSVFEFAEVVKINFKSDVPHFQEYDAFEYKIFKDSCGHKWHGAVYYLGIHGSSVSAIYDLPNGYIATDWNHSKYLYRSHGLNIGSLNCSVCKTNKKHVLSWPSSAFYVITYKQSVLWAFNRESAQDLKKFIESNDRSEHSYKWGCFLLHVPSKFKAQKARKSVVKKLGKLL